VACSIALYLIQKQGLRIWSKIVVSYSYLILIFLVTTIGTLSSGLLNWVFTIPLMMHILFSKKHAFYISSAVMIYQSINLYFSASYGLAASFVGVPNFILSYSGIWFLTHLYITHNQQIKFKISEQATRDPLTGALNRLSLNEYFEAAINSNQPLSLCLLDIDFFKQINDNYGHDVGDRILIKFVRFLRDTISADQVYRIGGEEFVILLPEKLPLAAQKINDALDVLMSNHFEDAQQGLTLSFSAGVVYSTKENNLSKLLKEADVLLYQAKNSGRSNVKSILN
jgi:diguanylate cyclase